MYAMWASRRDFKFASRSAIIPINVSEIGKLLAQYVLTFVRQGDKYQAVALVGLESNQSLYVNEDGDWLSAYIPDMLKPYPFELLSTESGDKILSIATEYLDAEDSKLPLFNSDLMLSEKVQQVLEQLNTRTAYMERTQDACDLLQSHGLIVPWELKIQKSNGQGYDEIKGLYKIDEPALLDLPDADFASLRSHAALALAYAQLFSLSQIDQLSLRLQYKKQREVARKESKLEPLITDQSGLNFDFLNEDNK